MENRLVESFIRPVRFAFVLGANPATKEVLRIITSCCEMLGGAHNLIIPTNGESLEEWWEKFLEASDPDMILYSGLFHKLDDIKSQIGRLNMQPFMSKVLGKSISLPKLMEDFALPADRIYNTKILEAPEPQTRKGLNLVRCARSRKDNALLSYFRLGWLSKRFESKYKGRLNFVTPLTQYRAARGEIISPAEMARSYIEYDHLSHFLLSCVQESAGAAVVAITGNPDSLDDCCLFWNWRALSSRHWHVEWVETNKIDKLLQNPDAIFSSALGFLPKHAKLLTSVSLGTLGSGMAKEILSPIPDLQSKTESAGFSYKHVSEYEGDIPCLTYFSVKETMPTIGGKHVRIGRKFPPPYISDDCLAKELIAELRISSSIPQEKRGIRMSPHNKVDDVLTINEPENWISRRVSKLGFSILLPPALSVDTIDVSSKSDWETLSSLCMRRDINIEQSPAGKQIYKSIELAGGIEKLASYYRNDITRVILDSFLEPHSKVAKDLVGQRREVYRRTYTLKIAENKVYDSLLTYSKRTRSRKWVHKEVNSLFSDWLEKGILNSGFQLSCPECGFEGWYPITIVGEKYTCQRCQSEVMRPPGAEIHFKLHESVYQAHKDNMLVPILTLDWLRRHAQDSFIYTGPVLLEKGNPESPEIDVLAIVDGKVIIGECKKPNSMSNKVYGRYSHLADKLSADAILFATPNRENTCENLDCQSCRQGATGHEYADETFSHGIPDNPTQRGDREKIRDFRVKQSQKGIEVLSVCAFELGL